MKVGFAHSFYTTKTDCCKQKDGADEVLFVIIVGRRKQNK